MAHPISVVVPTRDRPELLDRCLASIPRRPGDELIVVDSASEQREAVATVASERHATYLRCDLPGASRARNVGWRAARHDLVGFVDDDVCLHTGWAQAVDDALSQHPEVAWVTGRLGLPPDLDKHARPVAVIDNEEPAMLDLRTRSGDLGHSANLAVRKAVLEELGGFDELLGGGARFRAAEDLDLLDRILLTGRVGFYEPNASGWHDQWRERWELVRLDYSYGLGMGVRITKLGRALPPRARREASVALWSYGLRDLPKFAMGGHKLGFLTTVARVAGTCNGLVKGATVSVAQGHLVDE